MPHVTHFERTPDGQYTSIEQFIEGDELPEGTTFVGFDAVAFARATGQVALVIGVDCDTITDGGDALVVDSTDERWEVEATNAEDGGFAISYYGLGPAIINALVEHGVEDPQLKPDCLKIIQHVGVIRGIDYVGDGPLDMIGPVRRSLNMLPLPYTDVNAGEEIDRIAMRGEIDPNDFL